MAKVSPSSRTTEDEPVAPVPRSRGWRRGSDARLNIFELIASFALLAIDLVMLGLSFWLAWWIRVDSRSLGVAQPPPEHPYIVIACITMGASVLLLGFAGLYSSQRRASRLDDAVKVATRLTLAFIIGLAGASLWLADDLVYSRLMLAMAGVISLIAVIAGRFVHAGILAGLRSQGLGTDRLLIVGAGPTGALVLSKIRRSPQLGYDVQGFVRYRPWPNGEVQTEIEGVPILGNADELSSIVEELRIDEIVVAVSGVAHEEILSVILEVAALPVAIRVYPDTFRLLTSDILSISDLNGLPTVHVRSIGLRPVERVVKRGMDLTISTVVLIVLAPLFLIIGGLIKLTSRGPVFYVQERVGLDNRVFQVLKFRSMPTGAEAETGPVFATEDDARPTRLGRFMRRYSIDELPQFINVLIGEMSLVGPRPERPYFVDQFRHQFPAYGLRHSEKSGITGWAQVNGLRGDSSIEERTRYDLYYVENWSIFFDIKIMLKTLLHIFRGDNNAY